MSTDQWSVMPRTDIAMSSRDLRGKVELDHMRVPKMVGLRAVTLARPGIEAGPFSVRVHPFGVGRGPFRNTFT